MSATAYSRYQCQDPACGWPECVKAREPIAVYKPDPLEFHAMSDTICRNPRCTRPKCIKEREQLLGKDTCACCSLDCVKNGCQRARQDQEQTYATAPHRNRPVDFGELPPVPYRPNQPDNLDGSEFRYKHDDPRASWNQPNAKFQLPASPRTLRPNAVPIKTWSELTNEDWLQLAGRHAKLEAARAQHLLDKTLHTAPGTIAIREFNRQQSQLTRQLLDGQPFVAAPPSEQRVREIVREELNEIKTVGQIMRYCDILIDDKYVRVTITLPEGTDPLKAWPALKEAIK